ncbi:hypothetical protein AB3967_03650 [Pseudomonas rhodesiae]|uniref:hypothetical protein n=1 Tax=Pseudomonas rhodesiae TaxID=76760 RepID=UPI0034A55B22
MPLMARVFCVACKEAISQLAPGGGQPTFLDDQQKQLKIFQRHCSEFPKGVFENRSIIKIIQKS